MTEIRVQAPDEPPSEERAAQPLYRLVGATAGRASAALERSEDLLAQLSARAAKRSPARRAR